MLRLIHPPNLSSLINWSIGEEAFGNKHWRVSGDSKDMEHTLFHLIYYISHKSMWLPFSKACHSELDVWLHFLGLSGVKVFRYTRVFRNPKLWFSILSKIQTRFFLLNCYGDAVFRQCIVVHSKTVSTGGRGSWAEKDGDCKWWG